MATHIFINLRKSELQSTRDPRRTGHRVGTAARPSLIGACLYEPLSPAPPALRPQLGGAGCNSAHLSKLYRARGPRQGWCAWSWDTGSQAPASLGQRSLRSRFRAWPQGRASCPWVCGYFLRPHLHCCLESAFHHQGQVCAFWGCGIRNATPA